MQQETITATGIALRAIDVKENDRISILFTREYGLVKVYLSGVKSRRHEAAVAATPLVEAEWILKEGRDELFLFREASILTQNLQLRNNLQSLQAACDMLKASENALTEGDPAPKLYELLSRLLEKLPEAVCPATVKAIYQLKFLMCQGLLGDDDPESLLELAAIRSLRVVLGATLPPEAIDLIQELFEERFTRI